MVTESTHSVATERFDNAVQTALDDLVSLDLRSDAERRMAEGALVGASRQTEWFRRRLSYPALRSLLQRLNVEAGVELRRIEKEERRLLARLRWRYAWRRFGWMIWWALGTLAAVAIAATAWYKRDTIVAVLIPAPAPISAPGPAPTVPGAASPPKGSGTASQTSSGSP